MDAPFPDRRPCFRRPPLPSWEEIERITANTVQPLPEPDQRWSWWAVEQFDSGHGPKIVVCLHVMHGREEFEARFNVPLRYYHEKKVMVVRKPVTEHDFREVRMGIWDEIADKMETWPELSRVVNQMRAYIYAENPRLNVLSRSVSSDSGNDGDERLAGGPADGDQNAPR